MSTTPTPIKAIQATFTNAAAPTKNYSTSAQMALRNNSGTHCHIYGKFVVPGPPGANFSAAKLRLYAPNAIPSRTYRLRVLTSALDIARVKYSSVPGNTATGAVTFTGAVAAKGYIEFDIKDILNSVTAGTVKWFGFIISLDTADATARYFYNQKGPSNLVPTLDVTYSTAPRQPQNLNPSGGRAVAVAKPVVTADFIDYAGSTQLDAVQVKVHSTSDFSGTVDFDSGTVATSAPQLDLATTSFGGITSGQTKYWIIRYRDADTNWSAWSAVQSFTRAAKGTLTITSPAATPNDFVEDATPPITFTFTGTTQRSMQIIVWNDDKTKVLWDSTKITTTDQFASIPPSAALVAGTYYRVEVRVWDTVERTATPGDTTYVSAERRFNYIPASSVTPVTALAVTQLGETPWAKLTFDRTTAPDYFDIFRDGVLIAANIEPGGALVSGQTYQFVDRLASPRRAHKWEVRAQVNGKHSESTATGSYKTETIKPTSAYLCTLDGMIAIPFLNYSSGIGRDDGSTVVEIMNSDEPITVYQGTPGRKGGFDGVMSKAMAGPLGGETAIDHLNAFLALAEKQNQGRICILTYADWSIPCVVSGIDYKSQIYNEEIVYLGEFYITEKKGVIQ